MAFSSTTSETSCIKPQLWVNLMICGNTLRNIVSYQYCIHFRYRPVFIICMCPPVNIHYPELYNVYLVCVCLNRWMHVCTKHHPHSCISPFYTAKPVQLRLGTPGNFTVLPVLHLVHTTCVSCWMAEGVSEV